MLSGLTNQSFGLFSQRIKFLVSSLLLGAVTFAFVYSQPSIEDDDFNRNIWLALCSRNLPAPPRNESFPLQIDVYPNPLLNTFRPNQQLRVTLKSSGIIDDFDFGAFLIFATPLFGTNHVGQWIAGALGQEISCGNEENYFIGDDAAAQKNVTIRRVQELIWTAPSSPGNYVFELTTSQRFMVYWANQFSYVLRVV